MNSILQKLKTHLGSIQGAQDELLPPATVEELDAAEQELGIKFPEDFRQLYMWHNGNQGILFLFGSYRVFSHQGAPGIESNESRNNGSRIARSIG